MNTSVERSSASGSAGQYLVAMLVPVSWSFSFLAGKRAMMETPGGPATVTLLRFAVALVPLTPLLLVLPRPKGLGVRGWLELALLGLLNVAVYHYLFFAGLVHSPAGMASIVLAVLPILINLGARVFLKEAIGPRTYVGAVISFCGICVITLEKGHWSLAGWGRGESYILAAAIVWMAYTLVSKRTLQRHHTVTVSVYIFAIGSLLILPVALTEPVLGRIGELSGWWWASIAYLGVVAIGFGYVAFNYSVKHLGAGRTAVFLLAIPPMANVGDWLVFGTPLSAVKAVCIGVVLLGVWLALKRR